MARQNKRSNSNPDNLEHKATHQAQRDATTPNAQPSHAELENQRPTSNPSTLNKLNQLDYQDIEDEIGLEEIDVEVEDLNTIAADDIDQDEDWEDDEFENYSESEELISDLPQEQTQSYGTGLQGTPIDRSGRREHLHANRQFNEADAVLTGGDIDANYEQANAVGDESVGGTVATPDQDVVEDLGKAVGLEVDDRAFLRTNDTLEERDDRRWELDPKSSEDYQDRRS